MATVTYGKSSPYAITQQTSWFLQPITPRNIRPDITDKVMIIQPKHEFRPHNLSYELYGTANLWWVFMVINMDTIRDPINDFVAGKQIYVPTRDRLMTII